MPRLSYDAKRRRFVAICRYAEKDLFKYAGFRWDPDSRVWWTMDPVIAQSFSSIADDLARAELKRFAERVELSRSKEADADIPCPPGLSYMPFQISGILGMLERKNVLLADQMGLGKTVQVIGLFNLLGPEGFLPALIICPASVKGVWMSELSRWLVHKVPVQVVHAGDEFPLDPGIVVVNYDILSRFSSQIRSLKWSVLVCDEAHYLKNKDSIRTRQVLGDGGEDLPPIEAGRKIFLTGTPILNRPIEIWTLVHALDPGVFPSMYSFAKRYCDAKQTGYGWDFRGASNLPELEYKLRATVMIRRTKAEVLSDLPPKLRQVIALEPVSREAKMAIEKEWSAYEKHSAEILSAWIQAQRAKSCGSAEDYKKCVHDLRYLYMRSAAEMASMRHATAMVKVPMMEPIIRDAMDSSGKVVLWAHHHDVIDAVADMFGCEAVRFDGRMDEKSREQAILKFNQDDSVRLFVGSIRAGGLGITLTAASHVIFGELDWVPSVIVQAEDRCHRIGQKQSVLVQHVVLDGSIDAYVAKVMVEKQKIIDQALDGREVELSEPLLPPMRAMMDPSVRKAVWFLLSRILSLGVEESKAQEIERLLSSDPDPFSASLGLVHAMSSIHVLSRDVPSRKMLETIGVKLG